MTIVFTLCSINYLAQARTLGDSLRETNPEICYLIGLVDRLDAVTFEPQYEVLYTLIEVHTIQIPDFEGMCDRYNITELNTAVKPYYFTYLLEQYPDCDKILYFDPDIIVFQPLTEILGALEANDAVVTPHLLTPIEDRKTPNELHHLNTGIFNFGFVGFRRSAPSLFFLHWWEEKLREECLIDLCNGLFVDQHWGNFLPLLVEKTHILRSFGHNVAYWNLHERKAVHSHTTWYIHQEPLVFFHYSGYDPSKPMVLSKYQDRIELNEREDLWGLFELYRQRMEANGNAYYRNFRCQYIKPAKILRYQRIRKWLTQPIECLISRIDTL